MDNTVNLVNDHLSTYLNELTRLSVLPYYNNKILDIMQETGNISDTIVRAGYEKGTSYLTVAIEGLNAVTVEIPVR